MSGVARLGRGQPFRPILKKATQFATGAAPFFALTGVAAVSLQSGVLLSPTGQGTFSPIALNAVIFQIAAQGTFTPIVPSVGQPFVMIGSASLHLIAGQSTWTPITPPASVWTVVSPSE